MGNTWHSMYPQWLRVQAFHSLREEIMEFQVNLNSVLQIATVSPQGMKLLLTGIGKSEQVQQMAQTTWTTQMEQTTLGTKWKLVLWCMGAMERIREAITSGTALVVSDGSFQNQCSSCTWIIEGTHSEDQIEGSMLTPRSLRDHSSFQSEAAGVYSVLLTVWYFI